jgi:hypothetical protein
MDAFEAFAHIVDSTGWIRKHGEDLPEVRDWTRNQH